ncbi:MAG: hypothetical protein LQ349_001832 [Xanthoria aureola]|nr:MAG: hypothetical protein LQ349_001832 [Xanthoria aureola]
MRSQENGDRPSPTIPVVAGFTPINRYFSPVTPDDTNPAPISVPVANKGKKRQKKVSAAKPTAINSSRSRQSKKAKQAALPKGQTSAHASKPSDGGSPVHQKARYGDVLEPSVPVSASGVTTLPVHRVLQTSENSPSTEGLSSTYQAAFRREDLPIVSEDDNGFPPSSYLADEDVCRTPCSSCLQPAPTSDGAWTQDFHLPDHATGAVSGLKSVPDNTLASSNGLAPSYSGAMVSGQQYLLEPNYDHGDIATLAANGLTKIVPMEAQLTNNNPGYCDALDLSQFDDFLTRSTEEDCSRMDLSEPFEQTSETKCTSEREVVPEILSEPVLASDTLSYLSDTDQLQSPCNARLVNLSNSQPLVESSSLSSRSPSGHQLVSNAEALSERFAPNNHSSSEDMYNDQEVETGFLDLQSPPSAQVPPPSPPASPDQTRATRITEPHWLSPDPITPATSPVKQAVPVPPSMAVSTPASLKTRPTPPTDIPHKVSFDEYGAAIPFIRPVFPDPIRDRSHVLGLSSRTLLRTCFRIGEALNAGSTALRTRKDAVIELYARVSYSERPARSVKQHFHFADLFSPDKPPFLKGTYGLWKGVGLWDLDSKVFLGEKGKGKMARVVGRIGREEKTRGLEMTVLSIWEANWEDVGICKGHHCG